ncbi:MAG: CopD family protein [Halobacteriaceae archaeon]
MALLDTAMSALHVLFAGLWTGSVLFFALTALPAASEGDARPAALRLARDRLRTVSRTSAVVLLLTGGYMSTAYESDAFLTTTAGRLVLAMVVLWFLLAALVEVGASRMDDGLEADKVRTPARESRQTFRAAAAVAVLLLLVGGALAAY